MTRRLHVVQTIASIAESRGGPTRVIRDLSEALGRAGVRVSLIAGQEAAHDSVLLPPDPALATTELVPIVRRFGWPTQAIAASLARLVRPDEITIVHDNGIWAPWNLSVVAAARRAGLPLVISPHGMLEPWALAYRPVRKQMAWRLYQHRILHSAAGVVATSASEARGIVALVPGSRIVTLPNGVTCAAQPYDRSARDAVMPRTVLYLSRLHPVKNLPGLLTAWAALRDHAVARDWTLRIAGPDETGHRAEIVAQIAALGLGDRVRLDGAIAEIDKAAAFGDADLFILPSFSENFGVVVAEALAHSLPVIASTGTPWAGLATENCGWHVAPDPAALAAALATAMALPPATRRDMGLRGYHLVRRTLGWDGIAAEAIDFYRSLAHEEDGHG